MKECKGATITFTYLFIPTLSVRSLSISRHSPFAAKKLGECLGEPF